MKPVAKLVFSTFFTKFNIDMRNIKIYYLIKFQTHIFPLESSNTSTKINKLIRFHTSTFLMEIIFISFRNTNS